MSRVERTVELFGSGHNCSQAVMVVFAEELGMDEATAMKLGRPFGGGMGHLAETCGAITGAIMVLGLAQNKMENESEAKSQVFAAVQKLARRFESRHGTIVCKELLGADMSTEAGKQKIKEEQLVRKLCPQFVRGAAEILEELLGAK